MAKKEAEPKSILEREYIVPLRSSWLKVAKYRRAKRAMRALKMFIAKHMKVAERDIKNVKIDKWLNNQIWFRGIRKPFHKIKVKAIKQGEKVYVELAEIPEYLKFKIEKEKKLVQEAEKVKKEKEEEKPEEKAEQAPEKTAEEKKEEIEKEKSVIEAGLKQAEEKAKEVKHETKMKNEPKHQFRQALKK